MLEAGLRRCSLFRLMLEQFKKQLMKVVCSIVKHRAYFSVDHICTVVKLKCAVEKGNVCTKKCRDSGHKANYQVLCSCKSCLKYSLVEHIKSRVKHCC